MFSIWAPSGSTCSPAKGWLPMAVARCHPVEPLLPAHSESADTGVFDYCSPPVPGTQKTRTGHQSLAGHRRQRVDSHCAAHPAELSFLHSGEYRRLFFPGHLSPLPCLWLDPQGYSPARYFLLAFTAVALATTALHAEVLSAYRRRLATGKRHATGHLYRKRYCCRLPWPIA